MKTSVLNRLAFLVLLAVPPQHCFAGDDGLSSFFFNSEAKKAEEEKPVPQPRNSSPVGIGTVFSSSEPGSHISPPDARAAMRLNPEAPGPFIGLASSYFQGDMVTAKAYARQFVQYLSDLTFAVKDITRLIGEAMIEAQEIDEEQWAGVEQYLDYELATARQETGSPLKVTAEDALRRVKPDPKGEVEVYYFFTLNSQHARKMTPQIERLWQLSKTDPRIKFVALTLAEQPKEWIESYKSYTGLTAPVLNGELVAKSFSVKFVPAVVVVTPNTQSAYVRTGYQDFSRLYQFVKTAQGESKELTKQARTLLAAKIGQEEKAPKTRKTVITKQYFKDPVSLVNASGSYEELRAKLQNF
jgi:hypothetical protein